MMAFLLSRWRGGRGCLEKLGCSCRGGVLPDIHFPWGRLGAIRAGRAGGGEALPALLAFIKMLFIAFGGREASKIKGCGVYMTRDFDYSD